MALIHEKLYQSQDLSKIDFQDYLRALTRGCYALCAVVTKEHQRCADKPAQGNALGSGEKTGPALKGRKRRVRFACSALAGLVLRATWTQGVALGWLVLGLWPTRASS